MPARRTPRPLRSAFKPPRGSPDFRNYDNFKYRGNKPSLEFDWDAALYRHALMMQELGYKLTTEQQKRIDDHATDD